MVEITKNKIKKLLWLIPRTKYFLKFMRSGTVPSIEHLKLLNNLEVQTVVDIGANRGQFGLICEYLNIKNIYCIEPLEKPYQVAKRVLSTSTKVFQYAVGPQKSLLTMHVSKSDDSSSILKIGTLQNKHFPGTEHASTETVKQDTLRNILALEYDDLENCLLKIDVQGYELEVLKSIPDSDYRKFKYVYVECSFQELYLGQAHFDEIYQFLKERAYNLMRIEHVVNDGDGRIIQGDFLFELVRT